jgi:hypothetical protein
MTSSTAVTITTIDGEVEFCTSDRKVTRELMILFAFEKGYTDPQTVEMSHNLDQEGHSSDPSLKLKLPLS